jgi:hypothetical protein
MSTENIVDPVDTSLDTFAAEFFGQNKAPDEPASSEEDKEVEAESDANQDEDAHVDADDTSAPDNDDETGEDTDSTNEDAPKPKKNRLQERIDQLVKDREDEKRARLAIEAKLEELTNKTTKEPVKPVSQVAEDTGPKPTDTNEDGTEKYPLGEFDPTYIRDLMKHTLAEETASRKEQEKREAEQKAEDEAQASLQASWNEKLAPAKERYPDFHEVGEQMLSTFEGIDEAYGEYLTTTIMEMEYGPDVFYYLASNLDEATKIVQGGPKKATIALGRLEAKFAAADEEKQKARPRVSKAPPPPEHLNKGSAAAGPTIRGDEKDVSLDDFSRAFFKKRGS